MTPDEVRAIVRDEMRRIAEESLLELSMHDAAGTGGMSVTKMLVDELAPGFRSLGDAS